MRRTPTADLASELCESARVCGSPCCAQHTEAHRDGRSPQVHSGLRLRQSPALPICSSKHCLLSPTLHSPRQGHCPWGRVPKLPLPHFPPRPWEGSEGFPHALPLHQGRNLHAHPSRAHGQPWSITSLTSLGRVSRLDTRWSRGSPSCRVVPSQMGFPLVSHP